MNPMDQHLERLLEAAANLPSLPTQAPSVPHKAKVLARWRTLYTQPNWVQWASLLQHALGWVSVLGLVIAAIAVVQIKSTVPDEWSLAHTIVSLPWSALW